jgi:hypothetical protein
VCTETDQPDASLPSAIFNPDAIPTCLAQAERWALLREEWIHDPTSGEWRRRHVPIAVRDGKRLRGPHDIEALASLGEALTTWRRTPDTFVGVACSLSGVAGAVAP